jgi:signal transduction histidine kinase
VRKKQDRTDTSYKPSIVVRGYAASVRQKRDLDSGGRDEIAELNQRVVLEIYDNGLGIDAVNSQRLFEYGFTTKGKEGHGLGLASCRDYARELGGNVRAESVGGEYFLVRIELPKYVHEDNIGDGDEPTPNGSRFSG